MKTILDMPQKILERTTSSNFAKIDKSLRINDFIGKNIKNMPVKNLKAKTNPSDIERYGEFIKTGFAKLEEIGEKLDIQG